MTPFIWKKTELEAEVINQVKYRYQKRIILITDITTNATTVYSVNVPLQNCKNI